MKNRTDAVGIRNASAVHDCEQHADLSAIHSECTASKLTAFKDTSRSV